MRAPTGESGGDDDIRGVTLDQGAQAARRGVECDGKSRDDQVVRAVVVGHDGVHRIRRGVARGAVEGFEAGEEDDCHSASVGASVQPTCILAA